MIPDLDKISFSDLMKRSPQVKRAFVTPKFNFKFLLTLSQNLDIYNFGLGFSAGYVLFNKCGIGYSYRFNRAEIPRNAEGNGIYERQEKSSNHIYLNYYPGPLNWLLTTPGFKAFMGADVSLNKVYYFRSISSIGPDYNVNKYLPGFSITAGFDIYPLRNQSIGISAVQSFIKPMQIDELDGFKVRTSGFGIFFSMGFHF